MKKIFIFIVIFLLGINLTAYAELTQKKVIHSVSAYNLNNKSQATNQETQALEITDYVLTDDVTTNRTVKFYYYIPAKLLNSKTPYPLIVTVPGLDGDGKNAVYGELVDLAERKGYAILAPTFKFNQADFDAQKAYQYPAVWSGKALLDMLSKAKSNGLNYSRLYLVGFSAGAQFVSRFSFIYPDIIDACAIMSSGARVAPKKKTNVKYFVGIGIRDIEYRTENAKIFYNAAISLGIPIEYKQYSMEHEISGTELNDVVNFFERVRNNQI